MEDRELNFLKMLLTKELTKMEILNWKMINKNSLIATFNLKIPKWGNFIIREMSYFDNGNKRWISFPSRTYEHEGKKKYFSFFMFEEAKMTKAFQDKILSLVDEFIAKLANK